MFCPQGMFSYNETICLPCMPGYQCGSSMLGPVPCENDHWSGMGASVCSPCGLCSEPRQVLVTPCKPTLDTTCRFCLLGFMAENNTACKLPPFHIDPVFVISATVLVSLFFQVLLCTVSWYTYRKYRPLPR